PAARNHFQSGCRPGPAIRTCAVQIPSPRGKTGQAHTESFIKFQTGHVKGDICVLEAELILVLVLHSGPHDRMIENDCENAERDPRKSWGRSGDTPRFTFARPPLRPGPRCRCPPGQPPPAAAPP